MEKKGANYTMIFKVRVHPLSRYKNFSEKLKISNPPIHTCACAYQGIRNVGFAENFACLLNGWSLNDISTNKGISKKFKQDMLLHHEI